MGVLDRRVVDMNRLSGQTAVITGGATGIGRAAAKRFIEEGAFVFIFGRRQDALAAAVADLGPNARRHNTERRIKDHEKTGR
jgi:NAD(P)-dependent dehydrogenase (short-subunit alcohol dehydrogenase family)